MRASIDIEVELNVLRSNAGHEPRASARRLHALLDAAPSITVNERSGRATPE